MIDVRAMSNQELSELRDAIWFEQSVRGQCAPQRCGTFWGPGPPMYAARCILDAGHPGECDPGGGPDEQRDQYRASSDSFFEFLGRVREEAQRRMDEMAQ